MEAVTFPKTEVIEFIHGNFVPVRVAHDAKPLSEDFTVKWTPTLIALDPDGKEHHRTVGFLSPEELIASLLLGAGKIHFENDRFNEAIEWLDKVITGYPESDFAQEAIFVRGVSRYKLTSDPKPLKEAYEELAARFPESEWTKRAYPYRLL